MPLTPGGLHVDASARTTVSKEKAVEVSKLEGANVGDREGALKTLRLRGVVHKQVRGMVRER